MIAACYRSVVTKTLVDILEILEFIVKLLKVEASVEIPRRLVRHRVARVEVVDNGSTLPVVRGIVGCRCRDIIEERNLAERSLVAAHKGLAIAIWRAEALDALPYRVLPVAVFVGEQFFVHRSHRLIYVSCGI